MTEICRYCGDEIEQPDRLLLTRYQWSHVMTGGDDIVMTGGDDIRVTCYYDKKNENGSCAAPAEGAARIWMER